MTYEPEEQPDVEVDGDVQNLQADYTLHYLDR
jgi:hypothetical protein